MKWGRASTTLICGTVLFAVVPAHADDKSYLSYLEAHGFKYSNSPGFSTPTGAVKIGEIICQNLRRGHPARDRFDTKMASGITQVVIDAAQHGMCPETLATPPTSVTATPTTPAVPTTPLPPPPATTEAPPPNPEPTPTEAPPEPAAPAAPEPAPPAPEPPPTPEPAPQP